MNTPKDLTYKTEYRTSESSIFIEEYKQITELIELLGKIDANDSWEDISAIEQVRASFLSQFRELKKLKKNREKYYYDLFQMVDIGITYLATENINQDIIATLTETLKYLSKKITSDDLKKIRKNFRSSNISFMPVIKQKIDLILLIALYTYDYSLGRKTRKERQ